MAALLGVYRDKALTQKGACTSVFLAALFTVARTWESPRYSSAEKWIQKNWCIDTAEYDSVIKRNRIVPLAATWT